MSKFLEELIDDVIHTCVRCEGCAYEMSAEYYKGN